MAVQSIAISKKKMTKKQATKWAKDKGFKVTKIDSTPKSWRFRQRSPKSFKRIRSKIVSPGIVFIFGFK